MPARKAECLKLYTVTLYVDNGYMVYIRAQFHKAALTANTAFKFNAKQKQASYQSQIVQVESYFGWQPYFGEHVFIVLRYFLEIRHREDVYRETIPETADRNTRIGTCR